LTKAKDDLNKIPSDDLAKKEIDKSIQDINTKISNIKKAHMSEWEIVVRHERTGKPAVLSMANFIRNVYERKLEISIDEEIIQMLAKTEEDKQQAREEKKVQDFYGQYFVTDEAREWTLNHAVNVVNKISSS